MREKCASYIYLEKKSFVFQHSTCPLHFLPSQLIINHKFKFVNLAETNLFIVDRYEQADSNDGFLQSFHIPGKSVHLYSLQVKHYRTVTVTIIRYYSASFFFSWVTFIRSTKYKLTFPTDLVNIPFSYIHIFTVIRWIYSTRYSTLQAGCAIGANYNLNLYKKPNFV